VCLKCEPKVRERIRKSAYAAKSDILTKALSRPATLWESRSNLTTPLYLVELVQWASLIIQMVWHLLGVVGILKTGHRLDNDHMTTTVPLFETAKCLLAITTGQQLTPNCFDALAQAVHFQIVIAAITCWYIPTMRTRRKIKTPEWTMYYFTQVLSLCLRFTAWLALERDSDGLSVIKYRGAHAFMLITLTLVSSQRRSTGTSIDRLPS